MQRAEKTIRVNAPASKVYDYWRNFQNFPQFMEHVEEVRPVSGNDKLTHWKIKGPLGATVEFDSELTQDVPNKSIGWNSRGGSMETSGVPAGTTTMILPPLTSMSTASSPCTMFSGAMSAAVDPSPTKAICTFRRFT